MPFVKRDGAGKIVARFSMPQVDQLEWVADDSTELLPSVESLRAEKNIEINLARLAANQSSFPFAGKQIACDRLSRGDIDAIGLDVALNGSLPAGWPGSWKAVDNTYLPLADVAAFKTLVTAMVTQGNINFAHAQALKTTLAAATTREQVAAIVW